MKKASDLQKWLSEYRRGWQKSVGFVPTMGALHQGHLALVQRSMQENELTCCSIYVNPTQFNDADDLANYPRPLESDIRLLAEVGCQLLFLPDDEEIYPTGKQHLHQYPLYPLDQVLEGACRPGHFQGVANVVDRLLHLVQPDVLYLGQKDFQQVKVIERLLTYRNYQVRLVMCPTVRDLGGLALSSRNVRLSAEQRQLATQIWKELTWIENYGLNYPLQEVRSQVIRRLNALPETKVDYLECCLADRFIPIDQWPKGEKVVWVTAVTIGGVRLLDNVLMAT
ncbi:MAG: pantoate--beta-alanine ligase [Chitinophagales bacterium]|nr:pantoate--beta-alanine ligase [Chitinophagales bacterium]MDW8426942.1 pantoate--beta-alanine ligase [Chitinophagales bacterium]